MTRLLMLFLMLGPVAHADSFAPYEWMAYCAGQGAGACGIGREWTAQDVAWVHASVNDGMTPDATAAGPWVAFPDDRRGNCADYAVSYRAALVAFGFDPSMTRIEIGYANTADEANVHAVLVVEIDGAEWVMDGISDHIYRPDARPYAWFPIARQAPGQIAWSEQ